MRMQIEAKLHLPQTFGKILLKPLVFCDKNVATKTLDSSEGLLWKYLAIIQNAVDRTFQKRCRQLRGTSQRNFRMVSAGTRHQAVAMDAYLCLETVLHQESLQGHCSLECAEIEARTTPTRARVNCRFITRTLRTASS